MYGNFFSIILAAGFSYAKTKSFSRLTKKQWIDPAKRRDNK